MFNVTTFNFNLLDVTPEIELLLRTLRRNLSKQGITINLGIYYFLVFGAKLIVKILLHAYSFINTVSNLLALNYGVFY